MEEAPMVEIAPHPPALADDGEPSEWSGDADETMDGDPAHVSAAAGEGEALAPSSHPPPQGRYLLGVCKPLS